MPAKPGLSRSKLGLGAQAVDCRGQIIANALRPVSPVGAVQMDDFGNLPSSRGHTDLGCRELMRCGQTPNPPRWCWSDEIPVASPFVCAGEGYHHDLKGCRSTGAVT